MGLLSDWLDEVAKKAKKTIDEEAVPFLEKVDKLASELEGSAEEIRKRSEELEREANKEKERVYVEADVEPKKIEKK